MANKYKNIFTILFSVASVIYPALVFYFLVIRQAPLRLLSLFVISIALLGFIARTSKKKVKPFPGLHLSCLQ
jgi:hypothetical protein